MIEERKNFLGFSKNIWLIIISLLLIEAIIFIIFLKKEQAKTRDAIRISDMARIQTAFEFLFFEKASYKDAACQEGELVNTCKLEKYLPEISQVKDPGKFEYKVVKTPDNESYAIEFKLEKGIGSFKKGTYTLTPEGIKP